VGRNIDLKLSFEKRLTIASKKGQEKGEVEISVRDKRKGNQDAQRRKRST